MVKKLSILVALLLLFSTIIPSTYAQTSIKVSLDGKTISFDSQPFIENGRTLVPFRTIFEALGATVDWDDSTKTVTGVKGDKKIILKINSTTAVVSKNDVETNAELDVPAKIKNGRTFVPTRFIAENLDVRVYWDSIANTVVLLSDAVDPADDSKYLSKVDIQSSTKGKISFWHFNKAELPIVEASLKEKFPNIQFSFTLIPDKDSQYVNKLTQAVRAGIGVPDIITAESAMVKRFVNMSNCFYDLTGKVEDITGKMYNYTVDVGKDDNGRIRALSYNVYSNAIGYKRQVAKKYLGTDDPAKISDMLSSPDKMLNTAKTLKDNSGGKVALFPSWEELFRIYLGGRSKGWVVDNKLTVDPKISELIDIAKTFRANRYEIGFDAWSPGWSSAIESDETAMCWYTPTWGVPYIIGANDRKASDGGRWGLAKSPYPYYWGGTWLGVSNISSNKEIALGVVRYFVSNKEHLAEYCNETGDIPNNKDIVNQYKNDESKIDTITGQNLYKIYGDSAERANGKLETQYDDTIVNSFNDCMKSYLVDKISSKEKMLLEFKNKVKASLKDIEVD